SECGSVATTAKNQSKRPAGTFQKRKYFRSLWQSSGGNFPSENDCCYCVFGSGIVVEFLAAMDFCVLPESVCLCFFHQRNSFQAVARFEYKLVRSFFT